MKTVTLFSISLILLLLTVPAEGQENLDKVVERLGLSKESFTASKTAEGEIIIRPKNSVIHEEVYLNNASVEVLLSFERATFKNNVLIQGTLFEKDIFFLGAIFEKEAIFFDCEFAGNAYFYGAKFKQGASFLRSRFNNETNFQEAVFASNANFKETQFKQNPNFSKATFKQKADFTYSKFLNESVNFAATRFQDAVIFYKSKLPEKIRFNGVMLEKEIDLTSIGNQIPDEKCAINLYGTNIDKIRLNYHQIKLLFEAQLSFDQVSNVYYSLLKKQKNDGFTKSYELLDLDYQRIYHFDGIEKGYLYWINKFWWNFGYNKERIFLHAVWMFLLFFIINYIGFSYFVKNVYLVNNIKEAIEKNRKKHNNPRFLLKIFPSVFYYTSLIFFGLNLNIDNFNFSRPFGVAYIFIIYLSGLVCIAYMFNYIISL